MHDSSPASELADRIDAMLPQTQCTRCGYPACRPYAEAIARGETDINHCPPGGAAGIERSRGTAWATGNSAGPGQRRRETARTGADRRGSLYRLHEVHPGLSGRRHSRRVEDDAYGTCGRMYRLRTMHRTVSCRLHHDGCCRRRCGRFPARSAVPQALRSDARRAWRWMKTSALRSWRRARRTVESGVGSNAVLAAIERARARKSAVRSP